MEELVRTQVKFTRRTEKFPLFAMQNWKLQLLCRTLIAIGGVKLISIIKDGAASVTTSPTRLA